MNTEISHRDYLNTEETILIQWAREGDKQAFGEIYQQYVERIYNYCYYRTSNQQEAEDLTTRVFMRALAHIENYDERGVPFSAWLYRIAHNLVANWHRDNSRHKVIPLDDYLFAEGQETSPEAYAEQQEEQEILMNTIKHLPEDRQQLLFLKYVERLSNAEIGEVMNRTEGAIKSLYHRTLSSLHDDIAEKGIIPARFLGRKRKNNSS